MRYYCKSKHLFVTAIIFFVLLNNALATNYYWIGGAGNWSDINHWATTSGGGIKQSVIPTTNDNVIFDNNSGFTAGSNTVTVNTTALCDSMNWRGTLVTPKFVVSNSLQINGSLLLQAGMTISGTALLFTSVRNNESITTNGVVIANDLTFNSTNGAGVWKFTDSLKTNNGTITFTNGNLNFNGQYVKLFAFVGSGGNATRTLNIANSVIDIGATGFTASTWTYTGGAPLIAANTVNSQINIISQSTGMVAKAGDVYYNVTFNTGGTASNPAISRGIYNKVMFTNLNGQVTAGFTADSLVLAPGKTFTFVNGVTVNKYFQGSSPPCSGLIELYSNTKGTQITITIAAGAMVSVSNARIRDINIQGPATPYAANSSMDLGNNNGWAFTTPTGHTYYWVGGAGNWNSQAHWATTSNGTAGSGCVPTPFDEVIFDSNSGFTAGSKTVTVDGNAYCDSMTWSGSAVPPSFVIANPLEISGSLKFQPGMSVTSQNSAGITFVSSRLNETISTGNITMPGTDLTFNGTGGWNLADSLRDNSGTIIFTNGNLNFNGQYVKIFAFNSVAGNTTRTLNIANSVIDIGITGNTFPAWTYTGGVPLTADKTANSQINITAGATNSVVKVGDVYNNITFYSGMTGSNPGLSNGIFNKVTFVNTNGQATGSFTADSLILAPSKTFTFATGVTVNKYFQGSSPPCSGLIELYSSVQGTQRTITINAGAMVSVSNARIRDIKIQGPGVPYMASNSIDLSNNTGWTFTTPTAHTYYWVGGTGNWNSQTHWASTSGGTAGSGCVPTPFDNVIFDGNSGFTAGSKTVTVDGNAYCDSMTWSGSAVPASFVVANPLEIKGSLKFQPGMSVTSQNSAGITFTSSLPNETISTGNITMPGIDWTFNGTGGWNLADSLKNNTGSIIFTNGNLNFNGQYVKLGAFNSTSTNTTRTLNIANSVIDIGFTGNSLTTWNYSGGVPLTADKTANSQINITSTGNGMVAKVGDIYNTVTFLSGGAGSNPAISNGSYKRVSFVGTSGRILTNIVTDTLLFTANFTYTITSNTTTTINKVWYASGNPCFPTTIQSGTAGVRANISMPITTANYPPDIYGIDFVRMRDMNAVTGADRARLQTGNQSLANDPLFPPYLNNSNWITTAYAGPSGIVGLGRDTTLYCNSWPYTLNTVAFQGNPSTTYLWDNNSTGTTRVVNDTGSYNIMVNYGSGCIIKDTIKLSQVPNPLLTGGVVTNASTYDVTLTAGQLIGTPLYTLDSVLPANAVVTPITQASNIFTLPVAVTKATFHVTDQTTGCVKSLTLMGTPLPVILLYFRGQPLDCKANLAWAVSEEKNFEKYEVEYSSNGLNFATVGLVWPTGSNSKYNYTTQNQDNGKGYYRLKMTDNDGKYQYSNVISLQIDCNNVPSWKLYPNPVNKALESCTIEWNSSVSHTLYIVVTSSSGTKILDKVLVPQGNNKATIPIKGWSAGLYIVTAYNDNGTVMGIQKLLIE